MHRPPDRAASPGTDSTVLAPGQDRTTLVGTAAPSGASVGPESTPILPGHVVNGRYEVLDHLGAGGMGTVFRVRDRLHPRRPLALKAIRGQAVRGARLELFKSEFEIMARLRHPSVARVYDFEPLHGTEDHFFTLEHVDGQDVLQATEGLGWEATLDVLVQICRALAYVHSRQVTHSDLKPSNVMVTAGGHAKVLDFGLAGAQADWISGTPPFIAPEKLARQVADHRADLYSLGVLAYVLLTRRYPHARTTSITTSEAPPPGASAFTPVVFRARERELLPGWLVALVERLCAPEPADRLQTANAVIVAINEAGGRRYEVETHATRESYVFASRFLGRERERKRVRRAVEARLSPGTRALPAGGAPPLILVGGESGIGKTRLLEEVRRELQLSRRVVVSVDLFEAADEFAPLARALAHLVHLASATYREPLVQRYGPELVKILPELERERGLRPSAPIGNPEAEQIRLLDQCTEFLIELAQGTPYLMILNDLQWARPGLVRLLAHLLRALEVRQQVGTPVPLAILGSRRQGEANPALEALLATAAPQGLVQEIALGPLGRAHLPKLLCSMLGIPTLPAAFVDRVAEETAGNPFFVEEIMRSLVESGAVFLREGQWATASALGALDIPPTMVEVFQRRLDHLDPVARGVLELLTAAGSPLDLQPLAYAFAGEGDAKALHGALGTLLNRRMVTRVVADRPQYGVAHDRLRELHYGQIHGERRQQLHQRLGAALEATATPEEAGERLHALAYHFRLAGPAERDRALRHNLAAGDRARHQYANAQAIACFSYVRDTLGAEDPAAPQLGELHEKLGDSHTLQGSYAEALACYQAAARRTGDGLDRARIQRKVGEVYIQHDQLEQARDTLWGAVEKLGHRRPTGALREGWAILENVGVHLLGRLIPKVIRPEQDPTARARLAELATCYLRLCYVYHFVEPTASLLPNLRANRLAERLGPSEELSLSSSTLGQLYSVSSFFDTGERFAQRALDMASSLGATWHEATARSRLGMILYYRSHWDVAAAHLEDARQTFLRAGDLFELGTCETHIFACRLNQGRLRQAAEGADRMDAVNRRTGQRQFLDRGCRAQRTYARAKLGELDVAEAIAALEESAQEARRARDHMALTVFLIWIADLHRSRGASEPCIQALQDTLQIRESTALRLDYDVAAYPLLALALIDRQRTGASAPRALGREQRRIAGLVRTARRLTARGHPNYRSLALLAEAEQQWALGHRRRARQLFGASREVAARQGAQLWEGDGFLREARRLLADGSAPPAEAERLLVRARALYAACEAHQELAATQGLLETVGG